MPRAVITGGSAGFGHALSTALAREGWQVYITGRDQQALAAAAAPVSPGTITPVAGDVTDASHRDALVRAAAQDGPVDLLVNNASTLGRSPLPRVLDLDPDVFEALWKTNVGGPLALIRALAPHLTDGAAVVNISSDAAVEHYETWGGYAATKAALDHLTLTLAAEQPDLRWYAFDPGDMRTRMHQDAFPGEDISDRPEPETVVPTFLRLLRDRPASGRYRAADLSARTERTA
ncbi:SDR family oxidoreductase [Microlunatus soli]|uniref:Short chain dehydrogenase n=1 Tax=Microlunatus soli TaxID=630515 RepID=A0A1H1M873_9ACTN|nr:SDR family oxidoreductase [Microlunatus soli]SDR82229.1 short chain dehydrogenase [Microlunatus soli]